jgi:outer membrane protein, heavy metal efflux system
MLLPCTSALAEPSAPKRLPPTLRQPAFVADRGEGTEQTIAFHSPLPSPLSPVAGETLPISLADLERFALENNPALAAARARVSASRGRQVQAGLYPNPVIGYSGMEMGDDGTAGMQGGFVAQRVVTGGKLRFDRAIAGQEVRESFAIFDAQELRVLNDVRLRYFDALVAQRQVELTAELDRISAEFAASSRTLLEAQEVSQADLLQAEIEAEETSILAANAANRQSEAWRRLAAVVGMNELHVAPLAGTLENDMPSLDWEASYARLLAASPELGAAMARIERAQLAISRARRESIPDIDLMVSVHHMNTSGDDVVGVQAGIPVPVLNRNQGNIRAAEAEWIAARNEARRVELSLQDGLAMAFRRYADARQQAERYRGEILPRAERSLELVSRGYREGQSDYLTLLTSQRTYIRANLAYIEALAELWQAATLIEGQLLSGSLQGL